MYASKFSFEINYIELGGNDKLNIVERVVEILKSGYVVAQI